MRLGGVVVAPAFRAGFSGGGVPVVTSSLGSVLSGGMVSMRMSVPWSSVLLPVLWVGWLVWVLACGYVCSMPTISMVAASRCVILSLSRLLLSRFNRCPSATPLALSLSRGSIVMSRLSWAFAFSRMWVKVVVRISSPARSSIIRMFRVYVSFGSGGHMFSPRLVRFFLMLEGRVSQLAAWCRFCTDFIIALHRVWKRGLSEVSVVGLVDVVVSVSPPLLSRGSLGGGGRRASSSWWLVVGVCVVVVEVGCVVCPFLLGGKPMHPNLASTASTMVVIWSGGGVPVVMGLRLGLGLGLGFGLVLGRWFEVWYRSRPGWVAVGCAAVSWVVFFALF